MKFAFSTNAFKRYSLEQAIQVITEIGYDGIEILADVPHAYPPLGDSQLQLIKDTVLKCNTQISNVNAFTLYAITDVYHPSWIENDESLRELRIQHTIKCIELAKSIGSKNISTEPGGPIQQRDNSNTDFLKALFINELNKVATLAEKMRIKVLVEPEPSLLLENSTQFMDFIKDISSQYIKLNFDIGHFYCVREDPAETIYKLADYIEHFHLADIAVDRIHNHLIPGLGSIDFESVFKAINEIGYKEFVTVELYPYQDNPVYAAKSALKYVRGIANKIS
jgi:sugar phosphate isomerase/epimerase